MSQYIPQHCTRSATARWRRSRRAQQQGNAAIFWSTVSLVVAATAGFTFNASQPVTADSTTFEEPVARDAAPSSADDPSPTAATPVAPATATTQPSNLNALLLASPTASVADTTLAPRRRTAAPQSTTRITATRSPAPRAAQRPAAPTRSASAAPLVSRSTARSVEAPQARVERLQTELRGSQEAERVQAYLEELRAESASVQVSQR